MASVGSGRKDPAKAAPADAARVDAVSWEPAAACRFLLIIDAIPIGHFSECRGLEVQVEVKDHREGGENTFVHRLRGRMSHPNLVLKRGMTNEDALLSWLLACRERTVRSEGWVSLVAPDGRPLRTWAFAGAFPVKWTGPTLAAGSSSAAEETLEIAHHGLRPAKGPRE